MAIVNVDNVLLDNEGVDGWEYTNYNGEKDKLIVDESYLKFYTYLDYDVQPAYIHASEIDKLIASLNLAKEYFQKNGYRDWETDRKSTRLNSSHSAKSRMPSSA